MTLHAHLLLLPHAIQPLVPHAAHPVQGKLREALLDQDRVNLYVVHLKVARGVKIHPGGGT